MLEELLFDCDRAKDLHLILSSPGGDGEIALRMVWSLQQRCRELTVIVPDMAKSATTIVCLGAHHILMGPGGDLGPIDPQMVFSGGDGMRTVVSAKEIVAAVAEAEERIRVNPDSFPLFASLLPDVNMLMVEQGLPCRAPRHRWRRPCVLRGARRTSAGIGHRAQGASH